MSGIKEKIDNKKENKKKIRSLLEMPIEVVSKEPKITIVGFTEMMIENYKGILEYEDFYIRINTELGTININGFNLELIQMTEEDVIVTGRIQSIDIEEITDNAV